MNIPLSVLCIFFILYKQKYPGMHCLIECWWVFLFHTTFASCKWYQLPILVGELQKLFLSSAFHISRNVGTWTLDLYSHQDVLQRSHPACILSKMELLIIRNIKRIDFFFREAAHFFFLAPFKTWRMHGFAPLPTLIRLPFGNNGCCTLFFWYS